MSVSNETARISFVSTADQTFFNFTNIAIFVAADLKVYQNDVLLNSSAYTVTLSGVAPADGFITLNAGADEDDIIIIERDILMTQPTVYNPGTAFPAKSHEKALDRGALIDNDLALEARYSPKFNRGRDQNIDWTYTNLPDETESRLPVFDPVSKTVVWVNAEVLNEEGGTPASVEFSAITGTLDISGADNRVLDITLPFSGAVPLNLTERWQNWYTVKDFGAVGDDVADDFQAFVDCEAASGLGWVYVPSGTYKLSSNVTVSNVIISTGAVIKPDTGTVFTITGALVTGYDQIFDGLGSVKISQQRPIYTEWFGAMADGATDNIPFFDKAVDACDNNTCSIQLINGTYVIGSTWTITLEGAAVAGMGRNNTVIEADFQSGNDVVFHSNNAVYLGDLTIQPSVTKTSGAALVITATDSNSYSEFLGLTINNAFTGIHFLRASNWLMKHCHISNPVSRGIIVENQFATSIGSQKIIGCFLEKTSSVGIGILHVSGGDFSIESTNIEGFATQYNLDPATGVTGGNVSIQGCMLKNGNIGVLLDRTVGTGTWNNINLNSSSLSNHATCAIQVGDTVASWLNNVTIDGIIFRIASGATGILLEHQNGILIDSNIFNGISGTTIAVNNDASATNVLIGDDNLYIDITTELLPVPTPDPVIPLIFEGSKTHDFGSVAFEDEVNTTVTVTGAEPGMIALAQIDTMDNHNALLVAYVSATDTVTVALHNISDASAIDLDEGTLSVIVFNPAGYI